MRAIAVFPTEREVRLVDHEEPSLTRPHDVKLRMLEIGVCGTDREIAGFHYGTPPAGAPYLVLGHESLAEVVEVGPAVTRVKPGDVVVPTVRRPCTVATCPACRSGRQDFCFTGEFTERGIKMLHGFMTERIVEERYLAPVPAALREIGVLVEPLTIAEKALIQVWDVQERLPWVHVEGAQEATRHNALILGAGPVGLLGAMACVVRGFNTWVYSLEPDDHPKAIVTRQIGGHYISAQAESIEKAAERIGNIDLVYEATGAAKVSFKCLEVLGVNGAFVFTGVPGLRGPIELDAEKIMRNLVLKNQIVYGTVNAGPDAFNAAIDDLGKFFTRWPDAVRGLVTSRTPLAEARDLLLNKPAGIKEVISIS